MLFFKVVLLYQLHKICNLQLPLLHHIKVITCPDITLLSRLITKYGVDILLKVIKIQLIERLKVKGVDVHRGFVLNGLHLGIGQFRLMRPRTPHPICFLLVNKPLIPIGVHKKQVPSLTHLFESKPKDRPEVLSFLSLHYNIVLQRRPFI